ncbi:MAG: adenylosuccinate synthase [Bacteroidales bacterium]|nr:adenylosuccinate synthase [Bacteroidales bacterium]
MNNIDVLLGLQWGDEGKGKVVDYLTPQYDIIARFNGGPNAGHTLEFNGVKHVLRTIPSGICHEDKTNVIGNGVLIEPNIFMQEIKDLETKGFTPRKNLLISRKANLILPSHRLTDAANEKSKGDRKIGSTLKGIGPAYTDKIARTGLRIGDLFAGDFEEKYNKLKESHIRHIKSLGYNVDEFKIEEKSFEEYEKLWLESAKNLKTLSVIDTEYYINDQLRKGKKILAEGAQGTMLDIDFGSYPFVTSSTTVTAGVCSGLGIAPQNIGRVYGIVKAYCTRVGQGPFPTELFDSIGDKLCENGHEFGSVTGRRRRCGWLDMPALKYACMIDGVTDLMLMKIDVMDDFPSIKICTQYEINGEKTEHLPFSLEEKLTPVFKEYEGWQQNVTNIKRFEDLPEQMQKYISAIEEMTGLPVTMVSVSPDREDTIVRNK